MNLAHRPLLTVALGLGLMSCGSGAPGAPDNARKLADKLSGNAIGAASANTRCQMFSLTEITAFAGEAVEAGNNAGGGLGCQWMARDGSGFAMVTVMPVENYVVTSGAEGFRKLPEVGEDGFIAGAHNDWTAGAKASGKGIMVVIDGDKSSEAMAIALLKQAMQKVAAGSAAD